MNNQTISRRSMLGGAGIILLSTGLSGCSGIVNRAAVTSHAGRKPSRAKPLSFSPQQGLAAVNATRAKFGRKPFISEPRLQNAAQTHADLMGNTGNYGHEFGPGTKFQRRLANANFDGSAGENLGVGYGSVDDAIQGWLDSPKHRKILLRRNFDLAGVAYAFNRSGRNPRYTHYWVLIVGNNGRRRSAEMQPV